MRGLLQQSRRVSSATAVGVEGMVVSAAPAWTGPSFNVGWSGLSSQRAEAHAPLRDQHPLPSLRPGREDILVIPGCA